MKNTVLVISAAGFAMLGLAGIALAVEPPSQPAAPDWPQWRGPNRDGVALNSPKLLDSWPKEGPPRVWKSEWLPSFYGGGCSSLTMARLRYREKFGRKEADALAVFAERKPVLTTPC